jgi:carboxylesterase type B
MRETIIAEARRTLAAEADAHGVRAFKGIPSVSPPVGKLRRGRPQLPQS